MSQKHDSVSKKEFVIHPYDRRIANTLKRIENELSKYNVELIKSYDRELVNNSLAKATRLKQLEIILNLSRIIKKYFLKILFPLTRHLEILSLS